MGFIKSESNLSGLVLGPILLGEPEIDSDGYYTWQLDSFPDLVVVTDPSEITLADRLGTIESKIDELSALPPLVSELDEVVNVLLLEQLEEEVP